MRWLAPIALWLAVAPIWPEPHLVEKLRMLAQGTLVRPLDIFDLALHAVPLVFLFIRLGIKIREIWLKRNTRLRE